MKICSMCATEKQLSEFYSQSKHSKAKGNYIYHHPECKKCTTEKSSKWQKEHPISKIKTKRKYDIKPERRKIRREHNRKRVNEGYNKKYYKDNIEKFLSYGEKRRSEKKHQITNEEWGNCLEYFNCSCAYCGMTWEDHYSLYLQDLHKEHVIHDGKDDLSNCVPSCRECNSSKHLFSFNSWYNDENTVYSRIRYLRMYSWIRYDYRKFIQRKTI